MLKSALIYIIAFSSCTTFAQLSEVKFTEKSFENGMTYPQLAISDKALQDSINSNIELRIADLKESDFCIGQYGYVQKRTHLQINLFCTCIEFDDPQNRYFFYNLVSGKPVPYSDITEPKTSKKLNALLIEKAKLHLTNKMGTLSLESQAKIEENGIDAFQVVMQRGGLDLWLTEEQTWGEKPLFISWVELTPFLKYQFM